MICADLGQQRFPRREAERGGRGRPLRFIPSIAPEILSAIYAVSSLSVRYSARTRSGDFFVINSCFSKYEMYGQIKFVLNALIIYLYPEHDIAPKTMRIDYFSIG